MDTGAHSRDRPQARVIPFLSDVSRPGPAGQERRKDTGVMSEKQRREFEELQREIRRVREEADDNVAMQLVGIEITLARLLGTVCERANWYGAMDE